MPVVTFSHATHRSILLAVAQYMGIKFVDKGNDVDGPFIVYTGANALDFLSRLFDGPAGALAATYSQPFRAIYAGWCNYVERITMPFMIDTSNYNCADMEESIRIKNGEDGMVHCRWVKADEAAVAPFKARASDIGYDLTLIKFLKKQGTNLYYYDTGIKLQPDFGWYAEIVPRSSLPKSGYMLANSMGIIDRAYTGNIIVALFKVDPSAQDIELPFRAVQVILRPAVHFQMPQVDAIDETERGDKGFGSSGRN